MVIKNDAVCPKCNYSNTRGIKALEDHILGTSESIAPCEELDDIERDDFWESLNKESLKIYCDQCNKTFSRFSAQTKKHKCRRKRRIRKKKLDSFYSCQLTTQQQNYELDAYMNFYNTQSPIEYWWTGNKQLLQMKIEQNEKIEKELTSYITKDGKKIWLKEVLYPDVPHCPMAPYAKAVKEMEEGTYTGKVKKRFQNSFHNGIIYPLADFNHDTEIRDWYDAKDKIEVERLLNEYLSHPGFKNLGSLDEWNNNRKCIIKNYMIEISDRKEKNRRAKEKSLVSFEKERLKKADRELYQKEKKAVADQVEASQKEKQLKRDLDRGTINKEVTTII